MDKPLLPLDNRPKPANLAYLDGLRGIAALMVYLHHHNTEYYGLDSDLMHPRGYQGRYHFAQLPFLTPFFTGGTPAVMLFFVLSGFVLSRGTLQRIKDGRPVRDYLIDAALRRPLRLWLPPILVSLPVPLLFHVLRHTVFVELAPNVVLEYWSWFKNLLETVNPFIAHGPFQQAFMYLPPVWTMAYELNGSMFVYAGLGLSAFLSQRARLVVTILSVPLAFEYGHFSLVPFALGVLIAQLEGRAHTAVFVLGWWLLSDVGPLEKQSWYGLEPWIPFYFFHNRNFLTNIIGAALVVYSTRLEWLQRVLQRFVWLGRVSFALYLTHVPVMWFLAPLAKFDVPDVGPLGLTTRYLLMQVIVLPVNLGIAELVTRWVDEPVVQWSKVFASRVMKRLHL